MPLHLLPKKSWNPYNPVAIARVRADEEAAAAREEAEEQLQQQQDAERRLAILRGVTPPPLPPPSDNTTLEIEKRSRTSEKHGKPEDNDWRKKRRRTGEDDTDRDIRLAKQDATAALEKQIMKHTQPKDAANISLTDHKGHIQLFAPRHQTVKEKNAEAESEKKKREREFEDQYTMRFSNAAGFNKSANDAPWYVNGQKPSTQAGHTLAVENQQHGKNVWGREDKARAGRDAARVSSADPMAVMKKAQSELKTVERERELWKREKDLEIESLREDERRKRRKHRHRDRDRRAEDSLEGFNLDAEENVRHSKRRHEHKSSRHRREKLRSFSPASKQRRSCL